VVNDRVGVAAVRGVFWTGLGQILRQIVQVAGSIALARLLVPDDFGLLGMAMFFVGIGQLFADFGIGSAIIHTRSDDRVVWSSCFWLNLGIGAVLALLVLIASPLIAAFFKRVDLVPLVAVLSLNLLLAAFQVIPSALLARDMRFADIARAQVLGSLSGALLAVTLAWWGAGVWALVAQPIVGSTVGLLIMLRATHWRPHLEYSWPKVAPLARFSSALLATNLVGYANRNVDSLLVGRFLGPGPLGLYSMAIQLMVYPLQQVSSVIVRVLFPTLVQIRDDLPRLRAAYLRAVGGIALITFPMMGGLFAVADDFVAIVFGPDWADMAPVLKVVAWLGMMQSIGTTVGTVYLSTGKPEVALRVSLIGAPLLIVGMASGLYWGILGVATGYAIASFAFFYYSIVQAFRLIHLKIAELHEVIVRPLLATLAMVGVVATAVSLLQGLAPAYRLGSAVGIGILAYLAFSLAINRRQLADILSTVRSARRMTPPQ